MKRSMSKNSTPLLLSVLVLVLLFALFYYIVKPKMDEASALASNVDTLESEVSSLQEQIALAQAEQEKEISNEFAIRKLLPDNREIDELLLNFEEIEFVTGTRINSIAFNEYDTLVSGSTLKDPNHKEEAEGEIADSAESNEGQNEPEENDTENNAASSNEDNSEVAPPVTTIATETLPQNLRLLTYSIDIEAPDAEKLLLFIKEVERLERVMHVDMISYSLPGEEDEDTAEELETVSITLQVTTFYFE